MVSHFAIPIFAVFVGLFWSCLFLLIVELHSSMITKFGDIQGNSWMEKVDGED